MRFQAEDIILCLVALSSPLLATGTERPELLLPLHRHFSVPSRRRFLLPNCVIESNTSITVVSQLAVDDGSRRHLTNVHSCVVEVSMSASMSAEIGDSTKVQEPLSTTAPKPYSHAEAPVPKAPVKTSTPTQPIQNTCCADSAGNLYGTFTGFYDDPADPTYDYFLAIAYSKSGVKGAYRRASDNSTCGNEIPTPLGTVSLGTLEWTESMDYGRCVSSGGTIQLTEQPDGQWIYLWSDPNNPGFSETVTLGFACGPLRTTCP